MDDSHEQHNQRMKIKELEKQYENLLDDIAVATQSKNNLIAQNETLLEEIETESFNLDELEAAKNITLSFSLDDDSNTSSQSTSKDKKNKETPTFFEYFHSIEKREAVLKASIEITKKKLIEVRRNNKIQAQLKSSLEKELNSSELSLNTKINNQNNANNELLFLQDQYTAIENQNVEMIERANSIQNEVNERQKNLMALEEEIKNRQKNDITPLQEEIKALKNKIEEYENRMQEREKIQASVIENTKKAISQQVSVSNWLGARSVMIEKIRRFKAELERKQRSIEKEQLAKETLAMKFQSLLGNEDPGNGTGKLAKMIAKAEIDSIEKPKEASVETEFEIAVEKEVEAELAAHLEQVENSIDVFKKYRDSVMESLEQEYQQCSQGGYIALLQEERNNLKRKIQRI